MTDIVKNIENTEQSNGLNLPDNFDIKNFDIKIERSFQEFLKSQEFKNLEENSTKQTIQNKFNERLDNELHNLEDLKQSNISEIIKKTTFELQNFDTKVCLINLSTKINEEIDWETILETKTKEELENVFRKIENTEDFDPNSEKVLKEYIQKWERFWAIKEIFKIIGRFFKVNNETWLSEFNDLSEDIKKLDLENKTTNELNKIISDFEKQINKTWDIKKDLKLTYILSAVKDKKILKENPNLDKEGLLKNNLEIWDVILLNKKVKKLDSWSKALKAYDGKYDTDFVHSAIITSKDPIYIRHSTTFTAKKTGKWHVEEVNLFDYLRNSWTESFDLLSLRPDENTKQKILEFSKNNLDKEYDNNAAIWWWIRWLDSNWNSARWWIRKNKEWKKDDSFNCVEIIAQALDEEKLKNITHPNEFLEYMDIFQPTYITTMNT